MFQAVESMEALIERIDHCEKLPTETERVSALCDYYLKLPEKHRLPPDPYSRAYRDKVLEIYNRVSGRKGGYDAKVAELAPFSSDFRQSDPPPFHTGSSSLVSDMMICWGFIIRCMDLPPGSRVLEYGFGSGQILMNLARMGMKCHGIDIEPNYVRFLLEQAKLLGVPMKARVGQFGDVVEPGDRHDAVIFFEAFHHALDHVALVDRFDDIVADDGLVIFSGEPIIEEDSPWRPAVPFPWGPRLDLLSLRSSRNYGWLELGFQETYFLQLLAGAGWAAVKHPCDLSSRANCYVARRMKPVDDLGHVAMMPDDAQTWHPAEGSQRWTRARSRLTLSGRGAHTKVNLDLTSWRPGKVPVTVSCGDAKRRVEIAHGQTLAVELPLPRSRTRVLTIESSTFNPARSNPASDDNRDLGVQVGAIRYA